MHPQHHALQQRLQAYSIDLPDTPFPLSRKLAWENCWSLDYANRVLEEYKKFAFLAVVAGHPVTPSEHIDQAWHLHLVYTRAYWQDFCGEVLQMPLHHDPTLGGGAEQSKFKDWYGETLITYERWFGVAPPSDIWPPPHIRFGRDLWVKRINIQDNWIVPKWAIAPHLILRSIRAKLRAKLYTKLCIKLRNLVPHRHVL